MPSRHLDPEQARRYAEYRYDFNRKSLAGRVVLVPGGAGGLGAAITALILQDGAIPVVGYRSNKGNALAFQQKVQDLYGGLVHLVEGDVADPEARRRYVEAAVAIKGEVYGVVALTGDPARVKGGEDFAKVAATESDDDSTKTTGGVTPDVVMSQGWDQVLPDHDPVLDKAIEILKKAQ